MCTVLLPPGVNPIAVDKYISYIINHKNLLLENFQRTSEVKTR